MLIDPIISALKRNGEINEFFSHLDVGDNYSFAMPPNVRSLIIAAIFNRNPKPMLVVISGEEAARRLTMGLKLYLGKDSVLRFPLEDRYPWSNKAVSGKVAGERLHALSALHAGNNKVVVASSRSLMRLYPPVDKTILNPIKFELDNQPIATQADIDRNSEQNSELILEYEQLACELEHLGYSRQDVAMEPATFSMHGDAIDIFSADSKYPVRIEFFGDDVERIRKIVPATGQTVCDLNEVYIYPAREVIVSARDVENAKNKLKRAGALTYEIESELENMVTFGVSGSQCRFIPFLFDGTSMPTEFLSPNALTITIEPRSLFDDCLRYKEELMAAAKKSHAKLDGLYAKPSAMKFNNTQVLSILSLVSLGTAPDGQLKTTRGQNASSGDRFISQIRSLLGSGTSVVVGITDRKQREEVKLALIDAHIPIKELQSDAKAFSYDAVNIVDAPVSQSVVIPAARLAVLGAAETVSSLSEDATAGKTNNAKKFTFPYKPGDYVVHQKHGIAYFSKMEKQEVDGIWRDYLVLEYAAGDKLYIPVEQISKVTKYVGAGSDKPHLTRLDTNDWARAQKKASKAAKKLAFDLVDLYVRRSTVSGYAYSEDTEMQREMEELFPYEETSDQARAIADVKADMESNRPMDRLVCGDVGYGKTEVAIRAAFKAVQDGRQVMVLCPTTVLAQQHYATFSERFENFPVNVDILSRFRTKAEQTKIVENFALGTVDILIGTHRLLSRDVNPKKLGLVIIDEEQKFGVKHKEKLKNLREHIDILTLTATPIPRTLQMSLGGVREMSLIDTPPSFRLPVEVHVGQWDDGVVGGAIRRELERSGQVYYVATKILDIDDAVGRVLEVAPEARVGFAHGQMSQGQLESVMEEFAAGQIDVLVSTTIIESGLDNPHTNTLIIEDSHMLGLSQLYQLKGRVGRSHVQAYAYFMYPQDMVLNEDATERLLAIQENQDFGSGIKIAMKDLEIRGAGSMLGAEQSGNISAIGFEAFTEMLSDYVDEARGGNAGNLQTTDLVIDLPADVYLSEEYIPSAPDRVALYRKLALAKSAVDVDEVLREMVETYGELPFEALNLVSRSYIQLLMQSLNFDVITYVGGKVVLENIELSVCQRQTAQDAGVLYYAKSKKATFKPRGLDNIFEQVLDVLTKIAEASELAKDEKDAM